MSLSQSQIESVINAIADLGYPELEGSLDEAIADMENARMRLLAGEEGKAVRFQLYKQWAERAGCTWACKDHTARFHVQGTQLHTLVKQLLPDDSRAA
jgi:hypothetical protein